MGPPEPTLWADPMLASPPSLRLSQRFAELDGMAGDHGVTLGELVGRLRERGHSFVVLAIVLPFLQPIPLPLLSTIFGLVITLVGVQMALALPPWLPERLARRHLSAELLQKIASTGRRVFSRFERLVRPRGRFFHAHPSMRRAAGVVVALSGLLLSLPLPVPASNFLPALAIALVALGSLEEDGLVVVLGYVAFAAAAAFITAIAVLPYLGLTYAG